jgi:uncharacterized membrane protein required for colicin V production
MTPAVFDLTIVLLLLLSTALACWRGIIKEMFTIIGMAAAALGAWKGGHMLVPFFNDWLNVPKDGGERAAEAVSKGANADAATTTAIDAAHAKSELILGIISPGLLAKVCAYGSAFLAVFIVMSLVSFFVSRTVQEMGLGLVDRLLGALFGFARGFLVVFLPYVVCFIVAGKTIENFPDWAKNSHTVPVLEEIYAWADERVDIGKFVQDHGDAFAVKIDKKAFTDKKDEAIEDLKDAIEREEKERQEAP